MNFRRIHFAALAIGAIATGLAVHLGAAWMHPAVRDALGDALWAMMMTWMVATVAPTAPLAVRGTVALAVCYLVELSQLYHTSTLDALRHTTLGHLVLGTDFDARDLAWYALGVMTAVLLERALRRRTTA